MWSIGGFSVVFCGLLVVFCGFLVVFRGFLGVFKQKSVVFLKKRWFLCCFVIEYTCIGGLTMKKVPIGIEDYAKAQNYYYIDKTLLIKDILNNNIGKSLLVTRPRRFGKSLNLSMLEYFFSNKYDSKSVFNDKAIFLEQKLCSDHMNKYPVIRLNFKNIMATSYDNLCNQIISTISNAYKKFPEIANSQVLFDIEKQEFLNILEKKYTEPFKYTDSILNLSSYLSRIYETNVIILIDEYDTPIQSSYDSDFYEEAMPFFKSFYSSTLKGNEYALFSFITGVLEIGKESLFSGLNNLAVATIIDKQFMNYFGFTEQEVKDMLNYYNINQSIDVIKDWYGGYGTIDTNIFNPWSIINYIETRDLSYYWVNTGTNSLISSLIEHNHERLIQNKESFSEFLNNTKLTIAFNPKISYRDINNNADSLFSFLVQTGYLTARKSSNNEYSIFIPNKEIQFVFKNEIIASNTPKETLNIASSLKGAFISASTDSIKEILEKYILSSFSYYDLTDEKNYQVLITGILATLFDEYVVKSEVNNKNGRCDILISPKENQKLGIVIEIKKYKTKTSKARLQNYAMLAISQIKEKQYYQELEVRKIEKIILYGIAFDKKTLEIKYEEI